MQGSTSSVNSTHVGPSFQKGERRWIREGEKVSSSSSVSLDPSGEIHLDSQEGSDQGGGLRARLGQYNTVRRGRRKSGKGVTSKFCTRPPELAQLYFIRRPCPCCMPGRTAWHQLRPPLKVYLARGFQKDGTSPLRALECFRQFAFLERGQRGEAGGRALL